MRWCLWLTAGLGGCSPSTVIDDFWNTLDAEYGPFEERLPPQTTWAEIGETGRATMTDGASRDEVYDVLIGMARTLNDGHISINAPGLGRDEDGWATPWPHLDKLDAIADVVQKHYLDRVEADARGRIWWGQIGTVGYLHIAEMEGHSTFSAENRDALRAGEAVDAALRDLADTDGLIIDVRANEGGWDAVSLEIAGRFAETTTLAWSKQRRDGPNHEDFSPWRDHNVVPRGRHYPQPVVVLTSGATFSAAETFVLAMRTLPTVTVLGEPTSGHLSDMEDDTLPNRWSFTFSVERYRAADGGFYEATGIPPDVAVALDVDALTARPGRDVMLEAALERFRP